MRIGEVAIISHTSHEAEAFIRAICQRIDFSNKSVSFGRLEVNENLMLHLYGISAELNLRSLELISQKTLGFIIIFDWENKQALEFTKSILDHCSRNFNAPIVVVASIQDKKDPPIPDRFFQLEGIPLSTGCKFTFGQIDDASSARNIMRLLINMLIEKAD